MKYFGEGLSEQHKSCSIGIRKEQSRRQRRSCFFPSCGIACVRGFEMPCNEVDALLQDLQNMSMQSCRQGSETIAWVIWHDARIEDLTMNMLVARQEQVWNPDCTAIADRAGGYR